MAKPQSSKAIKGSRKKRDQSPEANSSGSELSVNMNATAKKGKKPKLPDINNQRNLRSYFSESDNISLIRPSIPAPNHEQNSVSNDNSHNNLSQSQEGGVGGRDVTNANRNGGDDEIRQPGQSVDDTRNGSDSPGPSMRVPGTVDPSDEGMPGQPPVGANQARGNERSSHSEPVDPETSYLRNANRRLISQMQNYEAEMEKMRKQSTNQKKQIKKLNDKCDTLQRKLSKLTGMRKFAEQNQTVNVPSSTEEVEKLKCERDLSHAKYASLKEHITVATRNLFSVLEEEPAPHVIPPTTQAKQKKPTKNNRPKFRPATVNINVSKSGKSGIHMKSSSSSTTTRKMTPGTNTVLWGTSLVAGMGNELRDRGIDATAMCFPGGKTEYMKNRAYPSFATMKTKPDNIVVQTAGNCCDDIKIPTESIISNYETIVQEIRRAAPSSRIVCSSIPPRRDNPWVNLRIKKVNDYLKTRGELNIDNVSFIDVAPKDLKSMFREDKVHFNSKGKAEYARGLKHEILNFPQLAQNPNV